MVKIEPGPELDYEVAKAIGLEPVLHNGCAFITPRDFDAMRGIEHPTCEGDVACISFQPSTDLDAAFAAAEKARLFNGGEQEVHLAETKDGEWDVLVGAVGYLGVVGPSILCGEMGYVSREATPALAICAEILKLKENQ